MTQAPEVDRRQLVTAPGSSRYRRAERQKVREVVGQVAAEVMSEVQAGTWQPPASLLVNQCPHASGARGQE